MDRRVQVLDRFIAMAVERALGVFHMLPGASHRFDRMFHARVRRYWGWGNSGAGRYRRHRCHRCLGTSRSHWER